MEGVGPDDPVAGAPRGTEPVFVGRTTTVQIAVTRPGPAPRTQPARRPSPPTIGRRSGTCPPTSSSRCPEHQRRADQPAAGAGGYRCRCPRQSPHPACRPTSSIARSGAPTRRCDAETRSTTRESGPGSSTTPPAATTTRPRIRPGSSGRSTSTTPARWAGATSPTTRWSTSTARSSRAARAESTDPSRAPTPAGFNRDTWGVAMLGNFDQVAADPIQLQNHRQAARLASGPRPRRPAGHGRARLGRRLVHQVPVRCHPDAADDLHPPRRRHHRMPGQRGVRRDGPDPRYRGTIQRPPGPARPGRDRCAAARSSRAGSRWAA